MGLTALDGLMMGTRCGQIDPGILLYLLQEKNYTSNQLEHLLYNESGLLGVSSISHDVRQLLSSEDISAKEAIELFCYRAALEFGSLSVALKGCDALVFTAGIGENSAIIRKKICERLTWLGINIDDAANIQNSAIISGNDSNIVVCVIPTNEEYMIAKHTWGIVHV
jgi:acetate kinase